MSTSRFAHGAIVVSLLFPHGCASPESGARVSVREAGSFELTGDGRAELVRVLADGPADDSLAVRLEIRSPEGALLYRDSWPSLLYFKYEDRADFSDSSLRAKVHGHLSALVADSSYYDPRSGGPRQGIFVVDGEQLAYSVAERMWRDAHSLPDSLPLPPTAHDEIRVSEASAPRVARLRAELERQPAFAYFAGGEATYTIAWSPTDRRFFTIWACC